MRIHSRPWTARVSLALTLAFVAPISAEEVTAPTDADLLATVVSAPVLQTMDTRQRRDLAVAIKLLNMPAPPDELPKILLMLDQLTKADATAQAQIRAMRVEAGTWKDLQQSRPDEARQYLALPAAKNMLPVLVRLSTMPGNKQPFDGLTNITNPVAQTPFGKQALVVREAFVLFGVAEKNKADAGVTGAKESLLVLRSGSAKEAEMRLRGTYDEYVRNRDAMRDAVGAAIAISIMATPLGPPCDVTIVGANKGDAGAVDATGYGSYQKVVSSCD